MPDVFVPKCLPRWVSDAFVCGAFVPSHSGFYNANGLAVDVEHISIGVAFQGSEHVLSVLEGDEAHALFAPWDKST